MRAANENGSLSIVFFEKNLKKVEYFQDFELTVYFAFVGLNFDIYLG